MKTEEQQTDKMILTRRQAQKLLRQIASMCEKAYRRGAQQAVAFRLSESDASW
jgi:hypothetical protein